MLNCIGKDQMFSIFGKQYFTFSPAKLSILPNSYFLISLAQNQEKIIFESWLAPSCDFFRKHGHFSGIMGEGFFFFFLNFVVPGVIITLWYQKNQHLPYFPRWSKNLKKVSLLVGFPIASFHWISKKFQIWATFTYIYNIS